MDTKQMFHGFHFRSHTDSTIGKLIRQEFIVLILLLFVLFFFHLTQMSSTFKSLLIMSFAYRSFFSDSNAQILCCLTCSPSLVFGLEPKL